LGLNHLTSAPFPAAILGLFLLLLEACNGGGSHNASTLRMSAAAYPEFEQVVDAVQNQRQDDSPLVVILEGTYRVRSTVLLDENFNNVTFTAADPDHPPTISGEFQIPDLTITGTTWSTSAPFRCYSFFVNGKRRNPAKMPIAGYYHADGYFSLDPQAAFHYLPGEMQKSWEGAELVAVQSWAESRMTIVQVDESTNRVLLSGQMSGSNVNYMPRYWIENVPEGLSESGTWMIDPFNKILYSPTPDEIPTALSCVIPAVTQLMNISNAGNIVFDHIQFSYTDWVLPASGYADKQAAATIPAAINVENSTGCTFDQCGFSHLGAHAVWFGSGCSYNKVTRCEFFDLGGTAVLIGYNPDLDGPQQMALGNQVTDNSIYNIGNVYYGACGITALFSNSTVISDNTIHDTFYTGISDGYRWDFRPTGTGNNLISGNYLYSIGKNTYAWPNQTLLSDMGGIYLLGDHPSTRVSGNTISGTFSFTPDQAAGIYLDQGTNGILVTGNSLDNIDGPPYNIRSDGTNYIIP